MDLASDICYGSRPKIEKELPELFKQLINKCWDTEQINRPSASVLLEIFNNWIIDLNDLNSELNMQIKKYKTENIAFLQHKKWPNTFYTSRLFNSSNLPKFDNSSQLPTFPISAFQVPE
ncbi:44320_t:CDS:1 [Gigaspora margarita]|uniref:44320_t:CDS:1 n=1 Tax=Gigaspora margarita TaxID=4874 RepID=A0ABN7WBQ5_GIGMA|nr:44320_t:CDS:1 [Gigaspora margarita]